MNDRKFHTPLVQKENDQTSRGFHEYNWKIKEILAAHWLLFFFEVSNS